ncbi:MAG TPA: sterol desaturase family protein [Armatimonadota bacterium]|nr:sterol desaturase family protein [Armatimonadota bacterium]
MHLWPEVCAALFWFVYACFFEWAGHRYFMHARRFPLRDAFRGHMAHHQLYRGDHRFVPEHPDHAEGITLRWYAFPLLLLGHLPIFAAFQWLTGVPTFWGAVLGCVVYFAGYEYTHYVMHVPRNRRMERWRWFRYIREHHRLHHQHMRCNYNVFVPLADACLGTLRTQ